LIIPVDVFGNDNLLVVADSIDDDDDDVFVII
jgi:hypothetical protein